MDASSKNLQTRQCLRVFALMGRRPNTPEEKSLNPGAGGGRAKSAYKDIAALVLVTQGWLKYPWGAATPWGTRLS